MTYARSEIISASKTAKHLGQILNDLKLGKRQRAVISKNNDLDAVILPIDEYEKMLKIIEMVEHIEIAQLINERAGEAADISFNEILEQNGIQRDAL